MKPVAFLKAAGGVACIAFALNVSAQTTDPTNNSTTDTPPDTASSAPHETASQHISDAAITTKVKSELLGAKDLKSTGIHVRTRKGIVRLTGTVPDQDQKDKAKQVAGLVSGVRSVRNNLTVSAD
jgi:hyperosmotically inducible protein